MKINQNNLDTGIIKITNICEREFKDFILAQIESQKQLSCIFVDTKTMVKSLLSKKYRAFVNSCNLVIPTTQLIKLIFKNTKVKIYSQFDFSIQALTVAEEKGMSAFIIGGDNTTIKKAYNNLACTYTNLKVLGMYKGNLNQQEQKDTILAIKKAAPTILIAGEKLPKNEKWIELNKDKLNPGIFIYTPITFSIMAGEKENKTKKTNAFLLSLKYLLPHKWVKSFILLLFFIKSRKFLKTKELSDSVKTEN